MKTDDDTLLLDLGLIDPKAPEGAFLMRAVNKFGSVHLRNREYKKRFSHAPHDRALLKELRDKAKSHLVDNVELLEAHYLWEVAEFAKLKVFSLQKHRLLRRWIRRFDPGLNRYVEEIEKTGRYYDIFDRSRAEYDRLNTMHYEWPWGCEPFYHRSMPDALVGMRAYGSGLIASEIKVSFDPEPIPGADAEADKGGTGEGSAGSGKRPTPKPSDDQESDGPRTFIVEVEPPALLPPWITGGGD